MSPVENFCARRRRTRAKRLHMNKSGTSSVLSDVQSADAQTGVLPQQMISAIIRNGEISATTEILPEQLQPSSLDLRLGTTAYRVRASFLPGPNATVMDKVKDLGGHEIDLTHGAVLEKGCVYVVPLQESLKLSSLVTAMANPKSSTGRVDVLTRLITDHGVAFDEVERGYKGPLYVEIAPHTFSILARTGSRLNQIRFHFDDATVAPEDLTQLHRDGQFVRNAPPGVGIRDGLVPVTIDLRGKGQGSVIGYRAKRHTDKIDIDRVGALDPRDFWEPIVFHREASLILDPGEFYILATCEEVGVPPHLAAEMVPYYTRSGEYRVHYAGFFDPGFGWDKKAGGSRAVLEVRSHEIPFMLEHGQIVAWMRYERMAAIPERLYGDGLKSHYQNQALQLSKHFRPFEG